MSFKKPDDQKELKLSAAVIIRNDDGKILLVKEDSKWGPPSGHTEESDTSVVITALREALEESGLKVEFKVADDFYLPGPGKPIGQFESKSGSWGFIFEGRVIKDESGNEYVVHFPFPKFPRPMEAEHLETGWFSDQEIHKLFSEELIRKPEINLPFLVTTLTREEEQSIKKAQEELGITITK